MRDATNATSALVTDLATAPQLIPASDVPTRHVIPSQQGENDAGDTLLRKGPSTNYQGGERSLPKTP